jgi:hypothetical protein
VKAKLGMIITEASGKLAGSVVSSGKNGTTIRNQPSLKRNNSTAIQRQKVITSEITQSWRLLTQFQRDQWNIAAVANPQVNVGSTGSRPSGFNVYCEVNYNRRLTSSGELRSIPPSFGFVEPLVGLRILIRTDIFSFRFDNLFQGQQLIFRAQIMATPSLSVGITNINSRLKNLPLSTSPLVWGANYIDEYSSIYGPPKIGSRISVRIRSIDRFSSVGSSYVDISQIITT